MGDERRINQLTAKAYNNIGSSDYFAVDNASEAESKKLPASSIKTPISNLQGEVTGGSDTYSSTKNYSVGMYATHTTGGVQKLYRCKTACTAASWTTNASCFEEANLADAVSQLNNDLTWEQIGSVDGSTHVSIPQTAKELLVIIDLSSSSSNYTYSGYSVSLNLKMPESNSRIFGGGVTTISGSKMYEHTADVKVINNEIYLISAHYEHDITISGSAINVTAYSKMYVFCR